MTRFSCLATALLLAVPTTAQNPPASFQLTVSDGTTSYLADFLRHSARGPNFSVEVQQGDGTFAMHTPGPVRTYFGTIAALPGAMASALRRADGSTYYHVLFADGAEWINNGGSTTLRTDASWTPNYPSFVTKSGGAGSDVWGAEIGVDLPNSQYSVDNDVDAALEMVEHSVNTVNLLYLRDASILHRLGRVVIRAAAARDPYAGMNTTSALLGEIRNQWSNVLAASTHDVALVATSATGGGLAAVGVIGNPGYSANGATREGDFTVVWRHEVGHNWSLSHYDGGTPEGKTINSGNALSRMSGPEQAKVIAHRDARATSLENLGPYSFPVPPRASLDRVAYVPQSAPLPIDVLDNDHDANGESFTIASFDPTTRLGGSVARSAGTGPGGRDELLYTPPAVAVALPDIFTYRIADSAGREGLGNVITTLTAESDLLAHLPMDEGRGTVANDSSAYLHHANLENGPVWTAGVIGGGIEFDGVDDGLLGPALAQSTDAFTITGWVKCDGQQSLWSGFVTCRGGTTDAGLSFGSGNELRYRWSGDQWRWRSGLVVPVRTWTFLALVVTPTAATIYMDPGTGMQSATNNAVHAAQPFDAALTIGSDGPRRFAGTMDDIRIHKRALTAAEISVAAAGLGSVANPSPAHLDSRNVSSLNLSWTSAPAATDHRVYFSGSYTEVRDGLAGADQGLEPASSWTTPLLGNGSWFWRVDTTDGTNWVEGPVWSFTIEPGPTSALVQTYGTGCPGSQTLVPQIGAVGVPQIGSATFAIEVIDAAPNASATVLFAAVRGDVPIGGCRLLLGFPVIPTLPVPTDSAGRGVLPLAIPNVPAMLGGRLFGQFLIVDAGGTLFGAASMSDGIHVTVGL